MKTISQILTELGVTENTTVDELIDLLTLVTVNEKNGIKSISVKPLPNVMRNKADELKDRLTNITIDENYGMSAVLDKRIALLYILLKTLNDNKAELNDDEQTIVANILKANQVTGVENGSGVINFTNGKITATVSNEINIGKTNKGKIQVGNDIKFITDGSSQMASVDDDGFHAGDFVIAYDYIKSENGSFDIESANGDTKIHIDDDEVDIYTPTENINLYDKEIEIKIDGTRNQTITLAEDSGNEGSLKSEIQNDTGVSSLFEQYSYGFKFHFYEDGSEYDGLIELYDDGVYVNNKILATVEALTNNSNALQTNINNEALARQQADNNLQNQIDGLNAGQNLADIVADLTALNNLSITNLKQHDKVQVLVDSLHENASTVYSLSISGSSHSWVYIGKYGQDSYTKAETNTLLAAKEDISNKVVGISIYSTDTQYPTAKAVWNAVDTKASKNDVYTKSSVDGLLSAKADLTNSSQVITADKLKINEIRDITGSGNVKTTYNSGYIENRVNNSTDYTYEKVTGTGVETKTIYTDDFYDYFILSETNASQIFLQYQRSTTGGGEQTPYLKLNHNTAGLSYQAGNGDDESSDFDMGYYNGRFAFESLYSDDDELLEGGVHNGIGNSDALNYWEMYINDSYEDSDNNGVVDKPSVLIHTGGYVPTVEITATKTINNVDTTNKVILTPTTFTRNNNEIIDTSNANQIFATSQEIDTMLEEVFG